MICFNIDVYRERIFTALMTISFLLATISDRTNAQIPATKDLSNSIGMKFRSIPAGEFLMGATPDEIAERRDQLVKRSDGNENGDEIHREEIVLVKSEGPQHRVTISKDFRLGTYEVTQHEFITVMGFNPSSHSATGSRKTWFTGLDTKHHPVDQVSWHDAVEFCRQLSSLETEVAAGRSYRLPTEAEWEYACRAGTTTKFFWGDDKGKKSFDWTKAPQVGTGKRAATVPVGSLKPNPWGLYDMTGNTREWCADWFDAQTYAKGDAMDPIGPGSGSERIVRGGMNFIFPPAYRSAARRKLAPDTVNQHIGFRVVCVQGVAPKVVATTAVPAQIETQLKQNGLIRQGNLFMLAEEVEFARFTSTLERMRVACFNARREVDDAKKQLQRVSVAEAGALQARVEARNMMRYSDTWREHRNGIISRNLAADALALVHMSQKDVENWLADAQADYDTAVSRFAQQCQSLRAMHEQLLSKQRELAADPTVKSALAAASTGAKASYRLGSGPNLTVAAKKLEHELTLLKQLNHK